MAFGSKSDDSCFTVVINNPVMHTSWEIGQYTSYLITLETSIFAFQFRYSQVRRRYSEFTRLKKMLKYQHPTIEPPALPPKFIFANKFSPNFIEQRRNGLETFLKEILSTHIYLSNRCLHLFLQSTLPMEVIERMVSGVDSKTSQMQPHLSMHTSLSNNKLYNSPKFDQTDRVSSSNNVPDICRSVCSKCDASETHSHVSMGSRITICSSRLSAPENLHGFLADVHQTDEPDGRESSDSNNSSPVLNASPTWDKCLLHGILSSRSSSQNSSLHNSPVRKKKVSFHSEVTVAHLLV